MPLPTRRPREPKDAFIERCMSDPVMIREFPDNKQRYAVCMRQAEQKSPSDRFREIAREQSKRQTDES